MSFQPLKSVGKRLERFSTVGRIVAIVGSIAMIAACFLSWAYRGNALDDVHYDGAPSPLQWCAFGFAVVELLVLLAPFVAPRVLGKRSNWFNFDRAARTGARVALVFWLVVVAAIALELGGLVTLNPGGWIGLAGALLAFVGTWTFADGPDARLRRAKSPHWVQILGLAATMCVLLFAAAFGLGLEDAGTFIAFAILAGGVAFAAHGLGLMGWLATAAATNRRVMMLAAFVVAFAFPFTQDGSDANMSIATTCLAFAGTALGLNIVVGLAGLLDLGYIAFLGAGAFTAALLSGSAFSVLHWHPPFIVTVLISGCVSAILGVIIGTPTLRVSGDYLAIVTLAFGEIFRITMNNLDGNDGPLITRGSNGIPSVPNLNLFGFDFGDSHTMLGVDIGRFANYYWLLLLVIGLIILVFSNLNHSRIGRGWVAIREDERAAEAMGVNAFALKLLAFAGGAFLAGVAGAVKAHIDVSVTPDQYVFMQSSFLVAAIVLGGMGTIAGVLVGAVILNVVPEKLRFFSDYRLLMFGLLLVIMMRFRPEGILPDDRRQLELHQDDEDLAEDLGAEIQAHTAPSLAGATTLSSEEAR